MFKPYSTTVSPCEDNDGLDTYYFTETDEELEAEQVEAQVRYFEHNYCN